MVHERESAGLSQVEVARRTGIGRTSYRLYEQDTRSPTVVQLVKIAQAFHVPLMSLARGIEQRAGDR